MIRVSGNVQISDDGAVPHRRLGFQRRLRFPGDGSDFQRCNFPRVFIPVSDDDINWLFGREKENHNLWLEEWANRRLPRGIFGRAKKNICAFLGLLPEMGYRMRGKMKLKWA